jgi:hypothetical protein
MPPYRYGGRSTRSISASVVHGTPFIASTAASSSPESPRFCVLLGPIRSEAVSRSPSSLKKFSRATGSGRIWRRFLRSLEFVIHVRHRPGIRAQAKDGCVLTRDRLRECGAVTEVSMQNLVELGVRYPNLPAANRRHTSNGWVVQRIAKGVSTDHSSRAHDYKTCLSRRRGTLMTACAPPASRRGAGALRIARCRPLWRRCRGSGAPRSSIGGDHHRL